MNDSENCGAMQDNLLSDLFLFQCLVHLLASDLKDFNETLEKSDHE